MDKNKRRLTKDGVSNIIRTVLKTAFFVLLFTIFAAFFLFAFIVIAVIALNYKLSEAVYMFAMSAGLMSLVFLAFINVRKTVKMAFADPYNRNYKRKTDKELRDFLLSSCAVAFFFTVVSFQIFIYVTLLWWFYYIIFMLMFSRVWKFHGKRRIRLFAPIILTVAVSVFAAPLVRFLIAEVFHLFKVY